jgi:methanogenic corrinoid protein MtbC1
MSDGLLRETPAAPNGRRVLLACVAGNQHTVGLQMCADAFLLDGWDVQYLGASVPGSAIASQVASFQPHVVGLSVSFAHQLPQVKDVIQRLVAAYGADRPRVLVGGLAINQFEAIAGQVGADAWSPDARCAVAQAHRLVDAAASV